jgi:DNA-binding transcriptional regulator GbsR (MarR family)
VNRSVAQIHALLYLSEGPLPSEDIAEALGLARSKVSNSIKELLAWKLVRRVPVMGERRDHFEGETDICEMMTRIAQGRKEREIDPPAAELRACVAAADGDARVSPANLKQLEEMLDFIEAMSRWYTQMLGVPKSQLVRLIKMGSKVVALLSIDRQRGGVTKDEAA